MVKFTVGTTERRIVDKIDNIRNVSIIAPAGYDKDMIIDSLIEAAGTASEGYSDGRLARVGALGKLDFADVKSISIPLYYEMTKESLISYKGQRDGAKFLINLTELPGHSDVPAQATNALCMSDGSLIVINCAEGSVLQPDSLICHALRERIRPVLCFDGIDGYFLNSQLDGETVYQILSDALENVNDIMSKFDDSLLGDVKFYPDKGTVAFSSDFSGWGFTLATFAKYYSHLLDVDESVIMQRLWGDKFFDSVTKQWTSNNTGTTTCKRGFVRLCYEPIKEIINMCMSNDKSRLLDVLGQRGLVLTEDKLELMGEDLVKCVMKLWLPANRAMIEMMIIHLPSPAKAQQHRVENLYRGPLNDSYAASIRNCDPDGPLVMYISKMIPASKKRGPVAFGRVFSGKVETGMKVCVMGSNHIPGQKAYYVDIVQYTAIVKGNNLLRNKNVPSGNIVAIGLNKYIPENATITGENVLNPFPVIRAISVDFQRCQRIPDITMKAIDNSKIEDFKLPYAVYDSLYLHQREGIRWLWSMHCKGSGAILADDMGLGKTRQACALLRGLFYSGLIKRAVIIAPPSVIDPWGEELITVGITNSKKFTDAKTRKHLDQVVKEGGLLCTTYGMFSRIEDSLLDMDKTWDYLFMDEGHRAKNRKTGISESLKNIKCNHKILLTGTPMQNNLSEFHNLMDICKPSLLGDHDSFHVNYVMPIDRGKHRDSDPDLKRRSAQISSRLAELTSPYILRRSKELLIAAGELTSNKYEYTIWHQLSPCQVSYYESLVTDDLLRTKGNALAATRIARDICRHPCLLMQNHSTEEPITEKDDAVGHKIKNSLFETLPPHHLCVDDSNISSKLDLIVYLVLKLYKQKHKILVFSQSPHMLKILEKELGNVIDKEKIIRMDGSTKRRDRKKMTKAFQGKKSEESSDSSPPHSEHSESSESCDSKSSDLDLSKVSEPWIFLMTTKVGGVGLNLTAATRVIIADPSENPSDDTQAVDRAYRIGQKKDVMVYRLVACGVIEEHTYREQITKIETSFGVLGEEPRMKSICEKEGLVLSLPPRGFTFCKTARELVRIYGKEMKIELSDLDLQHKSVIAISNHSLLYSVKEDNEDDGYGNEDFAPEKGKPKLKETKKEDEVGQFIKIDLPPNIVNRLIAHRKSRLKKLQRATDAAMDVVEHHMLISGDRQEIKKAQKLVHDFVEEVQSEKKQAIYIPKNKLWAIIGRTGDVLASIMDSSQAFVEIKDPNRGRKDLEGQKALEISGNLHKIQVARGLIVEKLKAHGIRHTIEECI